MTSSNTKSINKTAIKPISKNPKIAVLIPCYNEEKTIKKVVKDSKKALPTADIYVYDNNSTDDTIKEAKAAGAIIKTETRQGKGCVVRSMFREINADAYLMIDGDDTYPLDKAKEFIDQIINNNVDMVIGDRLSTTYHSENKRRFHSFGNNLVKNLVNKLFKGNIKDIMTGMRAFSKRFVDIFPAASDGFQIETEMSVFALRCKLKIIEIPIDYRDRPKGSTSKLNTTKDGFFVLKTIFSLLRIIKPFAFYISLAIILLVIGLILVIPVLVEYSNTGMVPKIPTLIVGCFFLFSSFTSFLLSFIGEMVYSHTKESAEQKIKQDKI